MDEKVIANIKTLAIDMIHAAASGHPGIVLGAAPILYTLYAYHLNVSTSDADWMNRDRFVMSAGHGSALLYATLYMAGYNLTLEDLKQFRHAHSKTPGHPEIGITPGVDMSTGPLGQGIASAVGMAIGEKMLKERTKFENASLVHHRVYVLCGDGDLMEGISYEAASIAGSLGLDNLIVLYDSNNISLDGECEPVFRENIEKRFTAMNWDYDLVKDGTDVKAIDKAIRRAKDNRKPTIIEIKTVIGKGSYLEGTNDVHGKPLTQEDIDQLKYNLQIPATPFFVDQEAQIFFRKTLAERVNPVYTQWANLYRKIAANPQVLATMAFAFNPEIRCNFLDYDFKFEDTLKEATRVTNQRIMNVIASYIPFFIGGSPDVASTTKAYLSEGGDVWRDTFSGRNLHFGVREHAMGAILNGLALSNFRVFGSSFLCFVDYFKPSIRLAALMNLPVTYILTHDSILVGQDGPTHQPIEQITMLRATPNLYVYRPCDAKELIGCWNSILNTNHSPSALILSRTDVTMQQYSDKTKVEQGAYIIWQGEKVDGILIASGTEVEMAITLAQLIEKQDHISIRVVSMPCMEKFNEQPFTYYQQILPRGVPIMALEAGNTMAYDRYVTQHQYIFGTDHYGVSGTRDEVLKEAHLDFETLRKTIVSILKKF